MTQTQAGPAPVAVSLPLADTSDVDPLAAHMTEWGQTHAPATPAELQAARRILICLRWGFGDVIMSLPSLRALRRAAPHAKIVAVGAFPAPQLFEAGDVVDEVETVQSLGLAHIGDGGNPQVRNSIHHWLGLNGPFDLVFDLLHAPVGLRQAVWEAGYGACEGHQPIQHERTARGEGIVAAVAHATTAGWGVKVDPNEPPRLTIPDSHDTAARQFFAENGLRHPAAIAPVASLHLKRWPAAHFAETADALAERTGEPVVMLCADQEDVAQQVLGSMRHPDRLIPLPARHLLETAALLRRCRLLVCNDTGVLHLSAAVQTPTVAIFGPTSPRILLPRYAPVIGLGGTFTCEHKRHDHLSMPWCWVESRCLLGGQRSCIDEVTVHQAITAAGKFCEQASDNR